MILSLRASARGEARLAVDAIGMLNASNTDCSGQTEAVRSVLYDSLLPYVLNNTRWIDSHSSVIDDCTRSPLAELLLIESRRGYSNQMQDMITQVMESNRRTEKGGVDLI